MMHVALLHYNKNLKSNIREIVVCQLTIDIENDTV